MNAEKWLKKHKIEGEEVLWLEGAICLTDKALYWQAKKLQRTDLGNIKDIKYDNLDRFYALDVISILNKPNRVKRLEGMKDAVKVRRLINEAIAKIPNEKRLEVTQDIVLNDINLEIPRSESSNDSQLKKRLSKVIGETDVDWLWVHQVEESTTVTTQIYMSVGIALILGGVVLQGLYTHDYGSAIMMSIFILFYLITFLIPLFRNRNPYTTFGVTHNRIVAVSKDTKKVEQLAISSIQTNKFEKEAKESYLKIETARKKIKIPNLKFDKEVQQMIENLKQNSDELRLLD
ncbi:MAG: hypothetical protein GY810_02120 [Aureispira sp.]|nr:hypothetical protein [Aureispira sp.]